MKDNCNYFSNDLWHEYISDMSIRILRELGKFQYRIQYTISYRLLNYETMINNTNSIGLKACFSGTNQWSIVHDKMSTATRGHKRNLQYFMGCKLLMHRKSYHHTNDVKECTQWMRTWFNSNFLRITFRISVFFANLYFYSTLKVIIICILYRLI